MSHKDYSVKRYSEPIGNRNAQLRAILKLIGERGSVICPDVQAALGMTRSNAQKAFQELGERQFISFSEENGVRGLRKRFALRVFDERELDLQLPTTLAMALAAGFTTSTTNRPPPVVKERKMPQVQRDPMDVMLMGHGPAPSLLFRRAHDNQTST